MTEMLPEQRYYLDASAAVKLVIDEPCSDRIRNYFREQLDLGFDFYMTSFCFYEALGVLKVKHQYRNEINEDEYFVACQKLIAGLALRDIKIDELSLTDLEDNIKIETLAKKYEIDLSDALQIATVKLGTWSPFFDESHQSILITADGGLAEAARNEGLRVWNIQTSTIPP